MTDDGPDPFTNMFEAPAKFARTMFAPFAEASSGTPLSAEDMREWTAVGAKLQGMWLEYQTEQLTNPQALAYINRLSDYLFVLARVANDDGRGDVKWIPGANR